MNCTIDDKSEIMDELKILILKKQIELNEKELIDVLVISYNFIASILFMYHNENEIRTAFRNMVIDLASNRKLDMSTLEVHYLLIDIKNTNS